MTKILIVEDSKFLRIATGRALTRAGYSVFSAADGDEALRMAYELRPDLILLDMMLPKTSGLEILKSLKANPETRSALVVVLSGLSQKNSGRLLQDGAAAFLEKSTLELEKGFEKLLAALQEILNKEIPAPGQATSA